MASLQVGVARAGGAELAAELIAKLSQFGTPLQKQAMASHTVGSGPMQFDQNQSDAIVSLTPPEHDALNAVMKDNSVVPQSNAEIAKNVGTYFEQHNIKPADGQNYTLAQVGDILGDPNATKDQKVAAAQLLTDMKKFQGVDGDNKDGKFTMEDLQAFGTSNA